MMLSHLTEGGVVAGNVYDKYCTRNLLARRLMARFLQDVKALVMSVDAPDIHEVGCGEGRLSVFLARETGRMVRGSDVSRRIISQAKALAAKLDVPVEFRVAGLETLTPPQDTATLVVCCEVLEHVPDPHTALAKLVSLANPYLLISVPREPIWRLLNLARGAYWSRRGNTPGHLQHWSQKQFMRFLSPVARIVEVRSPTPWTMVLAARGERACPSTRTSPASPS
jgi:SAM-dependent methyltransferase